MGFLFIDFRCRRHHFTPLLLLSSLFLGNDRLPASLSPIHSLAHIISLFQCRGCLTKSKLIIAVITLEVLPAVATTASPSLLIFHPSGRPLATPNIHHLRSLPSCSPNRTNSHKPFLKPDVTFLIINLGFYHFSNQNSTHMYLLDRYKIES